MRPKSGNQRGNTTIESAARGWGLTAGSETVPASPTLALLDARIAAIERRRLLVHQLDETGGYRFMVWLRLDAQVGELRRLRRDVARLVER